MYAKGKTLRRLFLLYGHMRERKTERESDGKKSRFIYASEDGNCKTRTWTNYRQPNESNRIRASEGEGKNGG